MPTPRTSTNSSGKASANSTPNQPNSGAMYSGSSKSSCFFGGLSDGETVSLIPRQKKKQIHRKYGMYSDALIFWGFTRKSWKQNPLKMARWDDTGCIIRKDNSYSCMDTECICTSTVLGKHACIPAEYQIPSAQVIAHFQIRPILTYLSYLHFHQSCVDMFCNYPSFSQQPGNACIPRK